MTFTPEASSINVTNQVGVETTPGTAVPANKRIDNLMYKFGVKGDFKETSGTGRKYPSVQQLNAEWVEGSFDGSLDYNSILYPFTGAMGVTTPVAHGASAVAKDWIIDASLSGAKQPQTLSFEQGDPAVRAHKFAYGLTTKLGYKFSRKTDASMSGSILAQAVTDGITLTGAPTPVVLSPIAGQHFDLYLDSTSAGLGVTQVLKSLSAEFNMDGIYGPAWYINRSNPSFSAHVDLNPTASVKFMVAADAAGMASLGDMRTGVTKFLRVEAQGPVIDNNQTVTIGGGATSGNFTLSYKGQTTANIAYAPTLTAATVQTAYQLLSTVLTNCTVSGPNGGPFVFTYTGPLATDTTAMTATNVSLTGGTPTIVVTQTQIYARFWHDMAIKIGQPSEWQDSNGVYAIEWTCSIFEDATWGHAHMATITNLLTAL
jgi:hypothetical protein